MSSAEVDFVHPSNISVDEPLDEDEDGTEIVESDDHKVENSEYSVINDEEYVFICAPPYSPDVSVHANSDEDVKEIDDNETIPPVLYLKHPLLKVNSQLCQLGQD